MGIKSTRTVRRSTALRMIEQEIQNKLENGSNREIEDMLETVLDIHNEKSRYYYDNFTVVSDDYKPESWEDVN